MAKTLYENWGIAGVYEDTWGTVFPKEAICLLAQTFTMGTVGTNANIVVEEIKLLLNKGGTLTGNLTVEIRNVDGSNKPDEVLATGTIDATTIAAYPGGWLSCSNFVGNTNLSASTQYAIVISYYESTAANFVAWQGENGGSYTGGSGWISEDNGKTWVAESQDIDFNFQVFGDVYNGTMCTYSDVINKSGDGANSTAKSAFNVGNYVLQAESVVNSRTRKNWTDEYSTLDEDVKYILNEIVSNLAAIKVINYNMNGYTTRLEAESMINQLKSEAERLIQVIRDENIQNFIIGA